MTPRTGVAWVGLALVLALPWTARAAAPTDAWTAEEKALLASLSLSALPPPPRDPSNAVDTLPAAAALGKRLFADVRLSGNGAVSCASCHDPERQFQDGLAVARGVGTGSRRTMPIAGAARATWLFWDGRKDSLWSQALGPLEDPAEHGSNRLRIAKLVQAHYGPAYEAVFGPLPDLSRLPDDAGPRGTPAVRAAWQRIDPRRRQDVSRIFANVGKAIAAYERTLTIGEARFDRYVRAVVAGDGDPQRSLSPQEVRGLRIFVGKGQCATCHSGPLLTDQQFHNTGVPPRDDAPVDRGRARATEELRNDEFNCLGAFSDAAQPACRELRFMVTDDAALEGAIRTAGLRNVALRAPYMHAGQFATLEQVIAHYVAAPAAKTGRTELVAEGRGRTGRAAIRLSADDARDLAAFLGTLTGTLSESPVH
jgi:cytochrome c peroxidase